MVPLTPRFREAVDYALELHAHQSRKGKPLAYASHLFAVTAIAMEHGADEDEAIAAMLHDAVEDQGGQATLEVIRQRFGERVASIVMGCTDADCTPKPPWRPRKEAYIAHVRHAPDSVRLISASDKLHNARSIVEDLRDHGLAAFDRFAGKVEGTVWYYRSLADIFLQTGPHRLAEELDRVVREMERLVAEASASTPANRGAEAG